MKLSLIFVRKTEMSMFMKRTPRISLLVIQHSDEAPGGVFVENLREKGCVLTILSPADGDSVPNKTGHYRGLVVLGGPQHASDDEANQHFVPLMSLMREFENQGKPVAGICLGGQLLARAWGASVQTLGFLELGFIQHKLTPESENDPVFSGIKLPPLMSFHEDTFDLPEKAVLLVEGENCRNQCFRVGRQSYGFQFHFEVNRIIAAKWVDMFKNGELSCYDTYKKAFRKEDFDRIESSLDTYISVSKQFCGQIAEKWLALVSYQQHSRETTV